MFASYEEAYNTRCNPNAFWPALKSSNLKDQNDALLGIVVNGRVEPDPDHHNMHITIFFSDMRYVDVLEKKVVSEEDDEWLDKFKTDPIAMDAEKPVYQAKIHCHCNGPEDLEIKLRKLLRVLGDTGMARQTTLEDAHKKLGIVLKNQSSVKVQSLESGPTNAGP